MVMDDVDANQASALFPNFVMLRGPLNFGLVHDAAGADAMKPYHMALAVAVVLSVHVALSPRCASATVAIQREPAEGQMRLGQRVRVDDGTCPAGQVKQVTAAQLTPQGIVRSRVCVKR
ncbi:MAG: DUF6719 family protein [Xanthobacteraceae bacterium]